MKKLLVLVIILNWIASGDATAAGWQGGGFFSGGVLFSRGFVDKKVIFVGIPRCRKYKQEYGSFYPAKIKEAGRLAIQVIPEDSTLFLNGYPVDLPKEGLPVNMGLLVGKYRIEVRKEGYTRYQEDIEIKTASITHLKIILQKEEKRP